MIVRYFVNTEGKYLGAFVNGAVPDVEGSVEVPQHPPIHGWQIYDLVNNEWMPLTDEFKQQLGID